MLVECKRDEHEEMTLSDMSADDVFLLEDPDENPDWLPEPHIIAHLHPMDKSLEKKGYKKMAKMVHDLGRIAVVNLYNGNVYVFPSEMVVIPVSGKVVISFKGKK